MITLDITKQRPAPAVVELRQGDFGDILELAIVDGAVALDLTGYSVAFKAYRPDGLLVTGKCSITDAARGRCAYEVVSNLTAAVGDIAEAYVELTKSGEQLTTQNIRFKVIADVDMTAESGGAYSQHLDEALASCADATDAALDAKADADAARDAANAAANEVSALLGEVVATTHGNYPRGHASGEAIALDDAYPAPLCDDPRTLDKALTIHGACHQVVTTGRNLLPYPYYVSFYRTSTTNGITFADNGDGTVTANGTASATAGCHLQNDGALSPYFTLPAGDYILSGCPSGGGGSSHWVSLRDDSNTVIGNDFGSGVAFTSTGEELYKVTLLVYSGAVASDLVFEPMIRLASEADGTFEQYSGGMASPRPDWPQPVTAFGERNVLPYPYSHTTRTQYGITWTDNGDGTVTASGTNTHETGNSAFSIRAADDTLSLPAGTYVFSACPPGGSASTYRVSLYKNGSWVVSEFGGGWLVEVEDGDVWHFLCLVSPGVTVDELVFRPMIRPVACEDLTWVPYGELPLSVEGKNLLDLDALETNNSYMALTRTETGFVGQAAAAYTYMNGRVDKVLLKAGDYVLSASAKVRTGSANMAVTLYNPDGTLQTSMYKSGGLSTVDKDFSIPFSLTADTYARFVFFCSYSTAEACNVEWSNVMLRRADTDASYRPYAEPSRVDIDLQGHELRALPDGTEDTLTMDGEGRVTLTRRVGKAVLDGSETWNASSFSPSGATAFYTSIADGLVFTADAATQRSMCDRLQYSGLGLSKMPVNSFKASSSTVGTQLVYVAVDFAATADELAAYLAENPMNFWYPLAVPETIDLGTLALPEAADYGFNRIELMGNQPAEFEVTYQKDVNIAIAQLAAAMI